MRMKIKLSVLIVALVIALSIGVFVLHVRGPIRLSMEDNGRTVELRVNDRLEVALGGNPSTGYDWEIASLDSSILRQVDNEFKPYYDRIGSPGDVILRFEAIALGQMVLRLIYHRPWENVPPMETFEATIVVKQ